MDINQPKKKKSLLKKILIGFGIFIVFLFIISKLFPLDYYKLGIDSYNKRNFSKALYNFDHVKQNDKNYNDAIAKIQEIKPIVDSLEKLSQMQKEAKKETKATEIVLTQLQKDSILSAHKQSDSIAQVSANMAKRKSDIESQFSSWDGAHRNLEKYIKDNMNDPDSYEHVSTNYWDMKDHLVVLTKYRGKNAFGGKVLGMTKAEVDLQGNVLKIIE